MSVSSSNTIPEIFNGHLGNLTADQERQFEAFKINLAKSKMYTPISDTEGDGRKKASHDDPTLLRFLRARNWDVVAAQEQLTKHQEWLKKHDIRKVLNELTPEEMRHTANFYPRWTGRRDKFGLPLFVYRIESLRPMVKDILAHGQSEDGYQKVAALTEFMTLFHLPLCTYLPRPTAHIPVSSTTSIVDLESASLGLMWQLRSHFQEVSQMSTDNYPEAISRVVIINAPSFFYIIWSWLKVWFDPHTQNKIMVLGKDPGPALREFIDAKDLPKRYGGNLDWEFEDGPCLDEDAKQVLGEMPQGPAAFVDGKVTRTIPLADEPHNV